MSDSSGACLLAGATHNTVNVWNAAPGAVEYRKHYVIRPHENNNISSVQWTANNKVLVMAESGPDGGLLSLHSLENLVGELGADQVHMGALTCARFTHDTRSLVAGSQSGIVYVWGLISQALSNRFQYSESSVSSMAISPSDDFIACASADGSLVLHTLNAARPPSILQPGASTATNRTVPFDNLCYSPINTSTLAASGEDNQVRIWSLTERPQVLTLGPKHSARITGVQTSFAFPDVLYSCSMDKTVVGWDMRVSSNAAVVTADLESPLSCLAVRDDGRLLAAGSIEGIVKILDARMPNQVLLHLHTDNHQRLIELHWQSSVKPKAEKSTGRPSSGIKQTVSTGSSQQSATPTTAPAGQSLQPSASSTTSGSTITRGNEPTQASLSNWIGKKGEQQPPHPAPAQQGSQPPPLKEATNKMPAPLAAAGSGRGGLFVDPGAEQRQAQLSGSSRSGLVGSLGAGGVEGVGVPQAHVKDDGSTAAAASRGLASPASGAPSPTLGSAAGRTPGGGTSKGLLRAGLSEAVFKNVMDETLSKLQERMREAQVGAIRQSFMQEVEMKAQLQAIMTRQEEQAAEMRALHEKVDLLLRLASSGANL